MTDPRRALMVGDNLTTDIGGAAALGLDTAWYLPKSHTDNDHNVVPTWEITRLKELIPLVLDSSQDSV